MRQRMINLIGAMAFLLAMSFIPGDDARADHFFHEPCASGQELRYEGFTAWRVSIIFRLTATNDFGEHDYYLESYFDHPETEGWGLHFVGEVRDVPSWERIGSIQLIAPNGLHHVWIGCFDGDHDRDTYGPILHEEARDY